MNQSIIYIEGKSPLYPPDSDEFAKTLPKKIGEVKLYQTKTSDSVYIIKLPYSYEIRSVKLFYYLQYDEDSRSFRMIVQDIFVNGIPELKNLIKAEKNNDYFEDRAELIYEIQNNKNISKIYDAFRTGDIKKLYEVQEQMKSWQDEHNKLLNIYSITKY